MSSAYVICNLKLDIHKNIPYFCLLYENEEIILHAILQSIYHIFKTYKVLSICTNHVNLTKKLESREV